MKERKAEKNTAFRETKLYQIYSPFPLLQNISSLLKIRLRQYYYSSFLTGSQFFIHIPVLCFELFHGTWEKPGQKSYSCSFGYLTPEWGIDFESKIKGTCCIPRACYKHGFKSQVFLYNMKYS